MATTNIRWAAAKRTIDLLRAHPTLVDVQVEPGWPGDTTRDEAIWLETIEGAVEIPVVNAGRKSRNDTFKMSFTLRVVRGTLDEVMVRISELLAAFEDVLADDPGLGGLDGVVAGTFDLPNGPEAQDVVGVGPVAFAQVSITVLSRLN